MISIMIVINFKLKHKVFIKYYTLNGSRVIAKIIRGDSSRILTSMSLFQVWSS